MKRLAKLFVAFAMVAFTSCDTVSSLSENPLGFLTSNTWALQSLMGQAVDLSSFAGGLPNLNFSNDGMLSGFTGCNNFNGNFNLDGTNLSLDPGAMTKKACPGTGEKDFLNALGGVKSVSSTGNALELLGANKESLLSFIPLGN
jgi:heat shock protein HslJ